MIEIKRGATVVWSGKASGKQTKVVMQEDRVELIMNHAAPITFEIGDTIEVYGQTYKLNRPENISRINTSVGYAYEIEFEALYYDLGKWMLYTLDKDNRLTEGDVFIMSDASVIVDLIVRNANRVSSGWSVGIVDATEVQQYTYSNSKLLTVLQDLADKNQLEFWVDGKVINLTRRQPATGLTFEYGKGKGLYQVNRERADDRVINSVRVLGGSRNLPADYGVRYLQPSSGNPMTVPTTGDIVEEVVEFANVYPRLITSVTYVGGVDYNIIRATGIDFDINNHLLTESAKVAFTSGQLAGFTFVIAKGGYDHATKQITLNKITDDPAYPAGVPNTVLRPAIGDKFVLLDIGMPPSYVTAAEVQLQTLGEQYLADYSVKRYNWRVSPTPKYILENEIEFPLGGVVRLKDSGLGLDIDIRIGGYVRDISQPHLYEVTLTNIIKISDLIREANKQDKFQSTTVKGLSNDGSSIAKPTLASVTANGKVTPLDITTYGTYNTGVLGVPIVAPKAEDLRAGFAHMWFNPTAPAGETPTPGSDFYIKTAKDANLSGIADGQVVSWSSVQGKFVPASFPSLTGYATQAWVNSQGFATQSWVSGQGFITAESDTLQSVTDRGSFTSNFIKIGGVGNVSSGDGLEFFFSGGNSYISSYGRDTSNTYLPLIISVSNLNINGSTNINGDLSSSGSIGSSGIFYTASGDSTQWNTAYTHSQTQGNPHNTQFSQLLNRPTTLAGFGITDGVTKGEFDGLQVGGVNLLLGTFQSKSDRYNSYISIYNNNPELVGRKIVISFYLDTTNGNDFQIYSVNGTRLQYYNRFTVSGNGKKYYSLKFTLVDNGTSNPYNLRFESYSNNDIPYVISDVKLEFGTFDTTYTPALSEYLTLGANNQNNRFSHYTNWLSQGAGTGVILNSGSSRMELFTQQNSGGLYFRGGTDSAWGSVGRVWSSLDWGVDVNASANTVVRRDNGGNINANYLTTNAVNGVTSIIPVTLFGAISGSMYIDAFSYQAVNQFLKMPSEGDTLDSVGRRGNRANVGEIVVGNDTNSNYFALQSFASRHPSLQAYSNEGAKNLLLQPDGGNTYVGKTSGSAKLDVAGTINADGRITATVVKAATLIIPTTSPNIANMQNGEVAVHARF